MLDDILLAQQSPIDHWGACGDQSVAYFAFLDFLGLLQPVEEQNYLLAGRASWEYRPGVSRFGLGFVEPLTKFTEQTEQVWSRYHFLVC